MVEIKVLVDDTPGAGFDGEHGLAIWIGHPEGNILYDTGESPLIARNARGLGVDLNNLNTIALSHGHYDHTGGLAAVLAIAPKCRVAGHPDMFQRRFAPGRKPGGKPHTIGTGLSPDALAAFCGGLQLSRAPRELVSGVRLTGEIPRETSFEDTGGAFFLDEACTRPDPIRDDQALVIMTGTGPAVLLGCAHAGIINTLRCVARETGTRKFALVAGGMHLHAASPEKLELTVTALRTFDIGVLAPGHCTGTTAVSLLAEAFPGKVRPLAVGWSWKTER